MCEFCDNQLQHKKIMIPVRNTYADDNVCEKIMDGYCEDCDGCMDNNYHFTLYKYDDILSIGFHRKISDVIISPTSETLQIKYCPWCGKKLTDEEVGFEKCCVEKLVNTER